MQVERHVKRLSRQEEFDILEGLSNSHHRVRDFGMAGRSQPYLEIHRCGVRVTGGL